MEFQNAAGVAHSEIVGSVERGYCGSADVVVAAGGEVASQEVIDVVFLRSKLA